MKKKNSERRFFQSLLKRSFVINLLIIFIFGMANNSRASVYSKNFRLSFQKEHMVVKDLIESIEDQSEFIFFYQDKTIDLKRDVQIKGNNLLIENVLKQMFKGTDNTYKIKDRQIIIGRNVSIKKHVPKVESKPLKTLQKKKTIQGVVKDKDGITLPGVSVVVKGTTIGMTTNSDGFYSLNVPQGKITLQFSFVGMKAQEVEVENQTVVNVSMETENTELSEMIVTSALGFKRQKRALGFSTQKIEGKDIVELQAPSLVTGLAGKAAGVNVTIPNGIEGGSQRIIIRGNNSINGNNQPLFVIDGIPVENKALVKEIGSGGGVDWGSSLNNINPYDIEEYTILKGPAAAALYGARGANGVIIINTKKGKSLTEGIGIEYSVNHRWNDVYRFQEMQNKYGFGGAPGTLWEIPRLYTNSAGEYYYPMAWSGDRSIYGAIPGGYNSWELFSWQGSSLSWGPAMEGQQMRWWDGELRNYSPQPNNAEIFYRTGYTTTHNIAFSGGGEMGNIRFSLTRTDNKAVVHNSDFEQTTANLGSNIKLSEKLSAKVSATYTDYRRRNAPDLGSGGNTRTKGVVYSYPRSWNPQTDYMNYKNEDGSRNILSGYPYGSIEKYLWWKIFENNKELHRNQLLGSVELNLNVTPWFDVLGRLGIDYSTNELETRNSATDALQIADAYYEHELKKFYTENFDIIGSFHKKDIVKGLDGNLSIGGTSWYKRDYQILGKSPNKFKNPNLFTFGNYDGTINKAPEEDLYEKHINSLYGFVNLSYKNYLFLDVTGRNDWSSTLPSNSNSYFYPSFSSSFVASELVDLPEWMNYLKVRLAYAKAATDADPYNIIPTFKSCAWGGKATTTMPDLLPPVELKPQISKTMDYGIEIELFESRLNFDFTYYNTKTENQILKSPLPWSSGFEEVKINTGRLQNKGIEFSVTGVLFDTRDFGWRMTLNASRNRNKLLELSDGAEEISIGDIWGNHHGVDMAVKVGEEYGVIRGKNKVYHENGQPIVDLYYAKGSTTEVIGAGYRASTQAEIIGNAAPDLTGGFSNMIRYKSISLSALIDFKLGGDIWSGDYATALMGGLSPETLKERDGGGLPYTYPSGETANHGVIIPGVLENGTPNKEVVHYLWKYGRNGWSMGLFPQTDGIVENTWVKLREVAITWNIPKNIVKKTGIFQDLSVSVIGRDLFYIYTTLPDNINPEGVNGTANAQGLMFGATPGQRSFGFSLRAIF